MTRGMDVLVDLDGTLVDPKPGIVGSVPARLSTTALTPEGGRPLPALKSTVTTSPATGLWSFHARGSTEGSVVTDSRVSRTRWGTSGWKRPADVAPEARK